MFVLCGRSSCTGARQNSERGRWGDGRKMTHCFGWRVPVVCNGTLDRIGALGLTSQSDESNEGRRFNSEPYHNQPIECLMQQQRRSWQDFKDYKGVVRSSRNVFQHSFHS